MTLARVLSAASGVRMAGMGETSPVDVLQASAALPSASPDDVDRVFHGYLHGQHGGGGRPYPVNPFVADYYGDSVYYPQYHLYNQGFGLKYGLADPSGHGDQSHGYPGGSEQYGYGGAGAAYGDGGGGGAHQGGGYHHSGFGGAGGGAHHAAYHHGYEEAQQSPVAHHHHHQATTNAYSAGIHHPRSHKSSRSNASAMSALTLLAFLFFLNILQSCLKEHMMTMNPTVMVMTAGTNRRSAALKNVADTLDTATNTDQTGEQLDYSVYAPDVMVVDEKMGAKYGEFDAAGTGNRTIQTKLSNFDDSQWRKRWPN